MRKLIDNQKCECGHKRNRHFEGDYDCDVKGCNCALFRKEVTIYG